MQSISLGPACRNLVDVSLSKIASLCFQDENEVRPVESMETEGAVVLLDLTGFSALSERLDHEAVYGFVLNLMGALSEVVRLLGGEVERFEGDMLVALFSRDSLGETYACRAVVTGLKMQSLLGWANDSLKSANIQVGARVGIDCGALQVSRTSNQQRLLYGKVVDRAALLEARAGSGTVLVSDTVRARAGGGFNWMALEEQGAYRPLDYLASKMVTEVPELESYDADCLSHVAPYLGKIVGDYDGETLDSGSTIEGERRNLTVLFVELDDLNSEVRDYRGRNLLGVRREISRLLSAVIVDFGGWLDKVEPRYLMAVFGATGEVENHCQRSLVCAFQLGKLCDEINVALAGGAARLVIRCGINTGMVTLAPDAMGHLTVTGDVVNVASRMATSASARTIQVTEEVRRLGGERFRWADLGRLAIKGKREPLHCFRVEQVAVEKVLLERGLPGPAPSLVLREAEVGRLMEHWTRLWRGRLESSDESVVLVGVVAEEGMGKTCLGEVFVERARAQGESVRVLRGGTAPYAQVPFSLWINLLRDCISGETGGRDERERFALFYRSLKKKVRDRELSGALERAELFLADLLSLVEKSPFEQLDAVGVHQATLTAIKTFLRALAIIEKRIIFILDDLHWIDSSSRELMHSLLNEWSWEHPLFVVGLCRSEEEWRGVVKKLGPHIGQDVLYLLPLGKQDAGRIVEAALIKQVGAKAATIEAEVTDLLWAQAGGNPFYIQEIVFDFLERDLLIETSGRWCLSGAERSSLLPGTLTELIVARLGRLEKGARLSLEQCAVIGESFSEDQLEFVNERLVREVQPEEELRTLVRSGFLEVKAGDGIRRYGFRHLLARNAVYETVLHHNRRVLHRFVAQYFEESYGAPNDETVDLIAYHWHLAGHVSKTVQWGHRAVELRKRRYQTQDGLRWLKILFELAQKADLPEQDPERWLRLMMDKEYFLSLGGNFVERESLLVRLLGICDREKLTRFKAEVLQRYAIWHQHQGKLKGAQGFYDRAYHLFLGTGDTAGAGLSLCNLGYLLCEKGRLAEGEVYLTVARDLCKENNHGVFEGHCWGLLGNRYFEGEDFIKARECYLCALRLFEAEGELRWQGVALGYLAQFERIIGIEGKGEVEGLFQDAIRLHRVVEDREYLAYDLCRYIGLLIDYQLLGEARDFIEEVEGILAFGNFPKVEIYLLSVYSRLCFARSTPVDWEKGSRSLARAAELIDSMELTSGSERLVDYNLGLGEREILRCKVADVPQEGPSVQERAHAPI